MGESLPAARSVARNPSQDRMRAWARSGLAGITTTEFGNLNYTAEVTARLKRSTYFVADHDIHQQRLPRAEADAWAARQDRYIAGRDMILVEGYIGPDPDFRTPTRLYIERDQANIAAMQQQLLFPPDDAWEPVFTVIYTPGLAAPGMPDDRLITVDLDRWVTRVYGSDYFGESKMGGLRMWNRLVYDAGGLAMHAGCKTFPADHTGDGRERLALVIGLSGTGKTTTTFRQQLGSLPVQDDFVALLPGGQVRSSENGCFAKTYGLDPDDEPTIYGGTADPRAWLENVGVSADGRVDFFDTRHTANGRSTFPLEIIRHREPRGLPPADLLLILNRNDNIVPAVARLRRDQAAAYFMLGETRGTSAGGAAEAGRNLRVPGTNPFFFGDDALQANRLRDLLVTMPHLEVFLLNTGRVGGADGDPRSRKVRIADSSAVVQAIVEGGISWEQDADFGYDVARAVPGVDDVLLRPRRLYEEQGRVAEYAEHVARLAAERREYLARYPALDPAIASAVA